MEKLLERSNEKNVDNSQILDAKGNPVDSGFMGSQIGSMGDGPPGNPVDSGFMGSQIGSMGDGPPGNVPSSFFAGEETNPKDSLDTSSAFKLLESNKYLYETQLQNVFDDYQKNITSLSQSKQKEIENAYYIREMSKKYLGEYASNVGIGDVSGNLIDIYSNYQQNLNDINQNFNSLEMNLNQQYQKTKLEQFSKVLETQFNTELAKMEKGAQDVSFAILSGQTNGVDDWTYLENAKNSGEISDSDYQMIWTTLYQQGLNEISENLSNGIARGTFGKDANGLDITDPIAYLNSVKTKHRLTTRDYDYLVTQAGLYQDMVASNAPVKTINLKDPLSEHYNPSYDPSYFVPSEGNVDKNSWVIRILGEDGNPLPGEYVQSKQDVEQQALNDLEKRPVSFDDLDDKYDEVNGIDNLKNEDIVKYKGEYFVFRDNKWYRMEHTQGMSGVMEHANANQQKWVADAGAKGKGDAESVDGAFKTNGKKADTLTVFGVTYVEDYNSQDYSKLDLKSSRELTQLFDTVHGKEKNSCVVFFQGKFWERNAHGNIVPMKKQTTN